MSLNNPKPKYNVHERDVALDHGLVGEGCHSTSDFDRAACAAVPLEAALRTAPVAVFAGRCGGIPDGMFCCG